MFSSKENQILPAIGRRLFSAPHLSRGLISLALIVIVTDAGCFLMGLPPEYWTDYSYTGDHYLFVFENLTRGPWLYLAVKFVYIIMVGLLLDGLSFIPSLMLWFVICLGYIRNMACCLSWFLWYFFDFTNPCSTLSPILTTILLGVFGIVWVYLVFVKQAREKAVANDVSTRSLFLSRWVPLSGVLLWAGLLMLGLFLAINKPVTTWSQLTPVNSPGPRVDAEIVYDSHRGKAVLFGGGSSWNGQTWGYENETWEWDGEDWAQAFPELSPPARKSFAMAYDESRAVTVMFGGLSADVMVGDTWEWDGQQWTSFHPPTSPESRGYHEMFYDSQREQVILYGGVDVNLTPLNEAWAWDGAAWELIEFESASPDGRDALLVYDESAQHVLGLLNSQSTEGARDTWLWQGNKWGKLQVSIQPGASASNETVYDPLHQQVIMFGGLYQEELLDETWMFRGLNWRGLNTVLTPSARWGHAMFYDRARERVIVFGGFDGQDFLDDMWELILPDAE